MHKLGKSIAVGLLSNAWLTLLLLALTPVYINLLGIESYGLIGFYTTLVAILGILDMGISATATREIAWLSATTKNSREVPDLLYTLEFIYWAVILMAGSTLFIFANHFGAEWFQVEGLSPDVVRIALMLIAVSLIVQVPTGLYAGGLRGLQRQIQCSSLLAIFGTLRGIGAVIVLWQINPDIRAFFIWQIIVSILQIAALRWSVWNKIHVPGVRAKLSLKVLQSVKNYAGGISIITAIGLIISQADKMLLSKLVSLEEFGYYMLAWNVASGLMLVASPLVQVFGPQFTQLLSVNDHEGLSKQLRLAAQLMSVLVLPPAVLIFLLSEPILYAWLNDAAIASNVAPVLTILVIGTAFAACSYPVLSMLYSRKYLKPVIIINTLAMFALLPLLFITISQYGSTGAAYCWVIYGVALYIGYHIYGLRGKEPVAVFPFITQNFAVPLLISIFVAVLFKYATIGIDERLSITGILLAGLLTGWLVSMLVCREPGRLLLSSIRSHS